ncbi:MAG: hypothetical protein CVU84_00410 [Firmicutes bacterium HGW-Firmicutes-1]|jgi:fluoroquinolone transport system permease protein|nr:MAG: hypothetical protein CVU84_00410 [Firmicutes bacterium HGW-Firmicutes-1]
MNIEHIKNDFKQLVREPMMLLLFCLPLVIFAVFKAMIVFLIPFLYEYIDFDLSDYYLYILSLVLILTPGMLGIVTGFMMLDERDGKIAELMSVTPLGRSGYLYNRLSFAFVATVIYTFMGYFIVDIYKLPLLVVFLLSVLLGIFSMILGMIIFTIATDKVKGLTYAKGLNIMLFFCLTDLLNERWLTNFSMLFPTYWITEIIQNPKSLQVFGIALFVHLLWIGSILRRDYRKSTI